MKTIPNLCKQGQVCGQGGSDLVSWLGQQGSSSPAGHRQSVFCLHQFVVSRIWAQILFPMPIPFGRKDAFWHHHCYSQSSTSANLLMFYLFLFELVIKGLTQLIQIPSSKTHYGAVAVVIFHSPNESNWILMTVDSIKQHLIGLFPGNFIFIVFHHPCYPKKHSRRTIKSCCQAILDYT